MKPRSILCVQLEHFYARVACLERGLAVSERVAVIRDGEVLDVSFAAARGGLCPGMRVREARRWFPEVLFVPAEEVLYPKYARPVLDICASYTPFVEPETPARIFLDVAGCATLHGSPVEIARVLARRIPAETGFGCVVGGGRSRLIASLATAASRVILPGEEREFLDPLPLSLIESRISREMKEWLAVRGVATFGAVRALPEGVLWRRFGEEGKKLFLMVRGMDLTPVRPAYPPRHVEVRVECEYPLETVQEASQFLSHLAFEVASKLRERHEHARLFRLELFFRQGESAAVASHLSSPVSAPRAIYDVLFRLFRKLSPAQSPVAMVVTAEEIAVAKSFQEILFPEWVESMEAAPTDRNRRLEHVLALLATRYGPAAIAPGYHLWTSRRPRFLDRVIKCSG